jgi:hypothetical protein
MFIRKEPSPSMSMTCLDGVRDLGADGGRETEAHRAGAERADEAARLAEVVVLRGPHLVLAHAGGDDGLALGLLEEDLDGFLRQDVLGVCARS